MLLTIKICGEIKIHSVNFFATSVSAVAVCPPDKTPYSSRGRPARHCTTGQHTNLPPPPVAFLYSGGN